MFIFFALGSCLYGENYVFAQTNQTALNRIHAAETASMQAFNSILNAEKAGANVTGLISQLNDAEGILAQAENSYRTGDYSTAATQADSILPLAQQVTLEAQHAKQTAIDSSQNALWSTITLTVTGVLVFVLSLFLVWRRFKRIYIKRLSEAKPELNSTQ